MDVLGLRAVDREEELPWGFIRKLDIPRLLGADDRTRIQAGTLSPSTTPSLTTLTAAPSNSALAPSIRTPSSEGTHKHKPLLYKQVTENSFLRWP